MTNSTDIGVAVRQGVYYRPDAKAHLNDYDYRDWLIKHKVKGYQILLKGDSCYGRTATLRKARKDHRCSACPEIILKREHYWSIVLNGSGLGSIKFPDRIHLKCLSKYCEREGLKEAK